MRPARAFTYGGFYWLAASLIALGCGNAKPIFSGDAFTADPPRPGPLNGMFVATNNGDDTLSAIDPGSRQTRWTMPVGFIPVELEGPHHIVADPSGAFFYVNLSEAVAGSGSGPHGAHGTGTIPGYTLKLSATDGSLVAFAAVDPNPGDLTVSADGKTLYVTHYDLLKLARAVQSGDIRQGDSNLYVIDTEGMSVKRRIALCPLAHGVHLSSDGQTLYSSCGTDEIAIVNLASPSPAAQRVLLPGSVESPSCGHCPYALSIGPDGKVWVSSLGPNAGVSGGGSLHVYDPQLGRFDDGRTVSLCGRALFAWFEMGVQGSNTYRVYVPEQGPCGDWIRAYRSGPLSQPPTPIGQLGFSRGDCLNAHMLMGSQDNGTGYLVCEGDHSGPGSLAFVDFASMSLLSSIRLGVFTDGIALIPSR